MDGRLGPLQSETNFTRRTFLASTMAAAFGPWLASASDESIVDALTRRVPDWMAEADVPGCSIALIQNSSVVWTKGFGFQVADSEERVDELTVFEGASLTKPMIAYLALKMVEQDKLGLDVPITSIVDRPITDKNVDRLERITVRHILSHSSGFPNWRPRGRSLRVVHDPGTRFRYSGEGYALLSEIIEDIAGAPLDKYMKRNLFEPLGLESASLIWRDDYATRLAGGHHPTRNPHGARKKRHEVGPAASVICTPGDYARFVCTLLSPPQADAYRLNEETIAAMLTPHSEVVENVGWGLGWGIQTTADGVALWHWGNLSYSYHNFVIANTRTQAGIVVFTNGHNGRQVYTQAVSRTMGDDLPALEWTRTAD